MRSQTRENKGSAQRNSIVFFICCGLWILFFVRLPAARAATLSELYGYLLEKDDFLLTQQVDFYRFVENSHHASFKYDRVESRLELFSSDTALKFSHLKNLEMNFAFTQALPMQYSRSTREPGGDLSVAQDYALGYLRDYVFQVRLRQGSFEPYVSLLEKRQKASWSSSLHPAPPNYFAYILTYYEDFCLGLRYLSQSSAEGGEASDLSLLSTPLLAEDQLSLDAGLRYRKAHLRRNAYIYPGLGLTYLDNYYHQLEAQYTPQVNISYGPADNIEFAGGLAFSFPYKYRYEYRPFLSALINSVDATFELENNLAIPVQFRYRPWQNLELAFSSDFSYCRQRLDYQQHMAGALTNAGTRKLRYFNTLPSLTLEYLYEADKAIAPDKFSRLTKEFLSGGQFLVKFKYLRDITALDKDDGNGALNMIDPYNIFLYPLDLFVAGTEYAATFTGNKSDTAANVAAQNYNLFQFACLYGLSERFNTGVVIGHRTSSRFHHFTLGSSSSFDFKSRYYVIKPYWFFSVPCDWRLNEESLLSLVWYYVPNYRTAIDIEGATKEFRSKTNYYSLSLALKVLF
jgi:hypothetical protein